MMNFGVEMDVVLEKDIVGIIFDFTWAKPRAKASSNPVTMDDDIDIEEHDVMEDPRIKSIFPDLSRVKIEIPDEEEEYGEQCNEMPPEEQPQEMHYQYEYSFETTVDNIEEDGEYAVDDGVDENAEYGDNHEHFYNNEIILGSKPPPDPEALYEEALNSHPTVYVENWEYKLKTSPCYCATCEILFPTVNALDAHKMISHSYLVALDTPQRNTARKSTVTSKYCNHCSKTFPDDTSLIKHLYELLPLNNFPKVEEKKEDAESKLLYMCQKCKKTFTTHEGGKWHKKMKHPSLSHVNNLIIKIQPKKIKMEPVEVKIQPKKIKIEPAEVKIQPKKIKMETVVKTEVKVPKCEIKETNIKDTLTKRLSRGGKFFSSTSLVPKSTIFQCNVCQIGFMSCYSASQHSKTCTKVISSEKCTICKRKIRSKEVKIHELQHNYTDKLKIYTVNKNLYERVLCKCPKCFSCLDEIGFWAHYQKCKKTDKKSLHCADCDVNIASTRYASHRLRHSAKKLTKKDFIIIEFHDQNNINTLSDKKIEILRKQRLKERGRRYYRIKKLNENMDENRDIMVYYCELCGCCQSILQYKGHADGSCKGIKAKKYCNLCGLCFTARSIQSHLHLHEKRTFSLKDVKIYNLTTGLEIEPPMPELLKCWRCEKHFLYKRLTKHHDCKTEKYVTCKICTKKFNLQAYKVHKLFHSVDKLIPELMKKYNSITNMWNVIYMCSTCELVTLTYDSAVTHSQGHLNYIISDLHKNCDICDLKIAEKDYSNHLILHDNNESLNKHSFMALKYKYEDLFKKEWMALFKPLPEEQKQQILSNSIYRYTRSVKMHIEINAPTDEIIYFCMNCKTYVEGAIIPQHLKSKCARTNKYVCAICLEIFKSFKTLTSHEGSHEKISGRTIVTFNNEFDQEFNSHLSLIETKSKTNLKTYSNVPKSRLRELLTGNVKKSYKIYKCAKCLVCVNLLHSVTRHNCVKPSARKFCEICDQFYTSKAIPAHMKAHLKKPLVNKYSLNVVFFNDTEKKTKKANLTVTKPSKSPVSVNVAKIFKCECGLHFTSMKTVQKHLDVCSPDLEVSKEMCSKCKLMFSTDVLVTHLVNHHSKHVKIQIEKVLKVNLLKCPHCLLCFTNDVYFNDHINSCDPKNGKECQKCHLSYDKKCFIKHICNSDESTCIFKVNTGKKAFVSTTVYKCGRCNICYLQNKSLKYHLIEVNHKNKTSITTCEDCGLRFTSYSFHKHEKIHKSKNEEYRIKVIDSVDGESQTIVGYNRNTNINKSPPKKRKCEITDSESGPIKIFRIDSVFITPERKSQRLKKPSGKASTSKNITADFDDNESVNTGHISDNINNTDDESFETSQDNINSSKDKSIISNRLKSRILVHKYDKKLYKCIYCNQHFMKDSSFDYHIKTYMNHSKISEGYECDQCGLDFSKNTLPRHKYVHHLKMGLKKEDFIILYETAFTKETKLYEKIDSTLNIPENDSSIEVLNDSGEIEENIDLKERKNDKDIDVSVEIVRDSEEIDEESIETAGKASVHNENSDSKVINDKKSEKISYYKCFDCNVCFIDQKLCYDHTKKHEILDPKLYIQCKICNFQFMIDSLKEHMDLHHNTDFMVENLSIQEYRSMGEDLEPKIDLYLAVDKVQSRLVSTTTDVGVV